eukprot:3568223-Pyramimonas_sp.AAC.1
MGNPMASGDSGDRVASTTMVYTWHAPSTPELKVPSASDYARQITKQHKRASGIRRTAQREQTHQKKRIRFASTTPHAHWHP